MLSQKNILEAYQFRHACKIFDAKKKISQEDLQFIMETARLSPSSFGMEHWRFIVITNDALKEQIKAEAWGQKQISSCSHLIAVVAKTAAVQDDTYIKKMLSRHGGDEEAQKSILAHYKDGIKTMIKDFVYRYMYKKMTQDHAVYEWSARQCYIAAANMTTSAAMIGIDSCFIEGFKKEKVESLLGINPKKEDIPLLLTFGYRIKEQPIKTRLDMDEIMELRA